MRIREYVNLATDIALPPHEDVTIEFKTLISLSINGMMLVVPPSIQDYIVVKWIKWKWNNSGIVDANDVMEFCFMNNSEKRVILKASLTAYRAEDVQKEPPCYPAYPSAGVEP